MSPISAFNTAGVAAAPAPADSQASPTGEVAQAIFMASALNERLLQEMQDLGPNASLEQLLKLQFLAGQSTTATLALAGLLEVSNKTAKEVVQKLR